MTQNMKCCTSIYVYVQANMRRLTHLLNSRINEKPQAHHSYTLVVLITIPPLCQRSSWTRSLRGGRRPWMTNIVMEPSIKGENAHGKKGSTNLIFLWVSKFVFQACSWILALLLIFKIIKWYCVHTESSSFDFRLWYWLVVGSFNSLENSALTNLIVSLKRFLLVSTIKNIDI